MVFHFAGYERIAPGVMHILEITSARAADYCNTMDGRVGPTDKFALRFQNGFA